MIKKYRIEQIAPEMPHTWSVTEYLYWDQEIIDLLKKDIDGTLHTYPHHIHLPDNIISDSRAMNFKYVLAEIEKSLSMTASTAMRLPKDEEIQKSRSK